MKNSDDRESDGVKKDDVLVFSRSTKMDIDSDPPGLNVFLEPNAKPLDVDLVVDILKNVEKYSSVVCDVIPPDPKAGNVFLFMPTREPDQGNYRKDQYMWVNHGPKAIPAKSPVIQKRYYVAKLPDGRPSRFHKSVYSLLHDRRSLKPCIIQYMGSMDGIAVSTKKSRIQAEKGTQEIAPNLQTKKTKSSSNTNLFTMARPSSIQPKKFAISREDLKLLHEFAYNLSGMIHSIQLAPKFQCIFGLKDISDHLEAILQVNEDSMLDSMLFSYSSSFEIGQLVLSPLLFSHVGFDGRPAIPSHFVIHEKGDVSIHSELFQVVQEMVPSLKSIHAPIVTEGDSDKEYSISKMGLNLTPVSSWKQVVREIKQWLYANGASQQEVATAIENVRSLMCSKSLENYLENLGECKANWGLNFQEYYMSTIDSLVQQKLGKWNIERWNIFNSYSGINDKSNESLEIVIQHLQELENVSCNGIVLACFLTQHYIRKEIRDGANGIGRLIARDEFNALKNTVLSWKPIPFLCLPENIVHYIKNDQLLVQDGSLVERTDADAKRTLLERGERICEIRGVQLNVSMQSFVVKDWERPSESFLVKLFPRSSCTCDSAMLCHHIVAVKLSMGIDMESELARLDSKFVTRALRSCENASEGLKPRRRRKRRVVMETCHVELESSLKRGCPVAEREKDDTVSDECDSEVESEANGTVQENPHVDFFQNSVQIPASAFFS